MKSYFSNLLLIAASLLVLGSCSTSSKTSRINAFPVMMWQDKPIVVDGINDEWSLPYSYTDAKARIEYSFANDKDNLYITLKTGDRLTLLKILQAGMQVWIDPAGKKNKTTGISFPLARTETLQLHRERGENRQDSSHARNMLAEARDFAVQGFKGCNGGFLVAQQNPCGIQVGIGLDASGELIWEAAIPLRSFLNEAALQHFSSKPLGIGFEIHALPKPAGSGGQNGGGMHMGGGMGGGRMGGRGGMRGGGGRSRSMSNGGGDRSTLFNSSSSWEKVNLAKPKAN